MKAAAIIAALLLAGCSGDFYPPGDERVIGDVPPICTFFGYHQFDESMDPSCAKPEGAKRVGGLWVRE